MVLAWDYTEPYETVLLDGVDVGEGRYGWIKLKGIPYGRLFQVSVVSRQGESAKYPIRSATFTLGEIRDLRVKSTTSTSVTIDSDDFRSRPQLDFEIRRDGVSLGLLAEDLPFPRSFVDTGLTPGTTYVYTVTAVANGADGTAVPRTVQATTDGVAPGQAPPVPTAVNSFVDRSRAVIRVSTSSPDRSRQVQQHLVIYRDGALISEIDSRPKWEEFTYYTDTGIDRSRETVYEVVSVSATGIRSEPARIVVPALSEAEG